MTSSFRFVAAKRRKARRQWVCETCNILIEPGSPYHMETWHDISFTWQGDGWFRRAACQACGDDPIRGLTLAHHQIPDPQPVCPHDICPWASLVVAADGPQGQLPAAQRFLQRHHQAMEAGIFSGRCHHHADYLIDPAIDDDPWFCWENADGVMS